MTVCSGRGCSLLSENYFRVVDSQELVLAPGSSSWSLNTAATVCFVGSQYWPPKMSSVPVRVELGDITPHNIKQLKKLNSVIFPVFYNDKFYRNVLEQGEFSKLAYFNDVVVGAMCCRLENVPDGAGKQVYIMTLGCLAPYRRLGTGSLLLEHVFKICRQRKDVESICLHVQINNEEAIAFYRKFGFEITETEEAYYKRIEPSSAYVLRKNTADL